jgi:accessory gene regulator protein AgrB
MSSINRPDVRLQSISVSYVFFTWQTGGVHVRGSLGCYVDITGGFNLYIRLS